MKRILLLTAALAATFTISAQVEFRPFGGVNFSNITETPQGVSTKAKLGTQFGVNAAFGNTIFFQPGIAYVKRSTEYSSAGNTNFDQTINGVQVPLLVGVRFIDAASEPLVNVRVFAGPSMFFHTRTRYSGGQVEEAVDWNRTQWSAMGGVGLDIAIFFVEAGYEFGLSNSGTVRDDFPDTWNDFKSNTFYVNAGLRLALTR